MANPSSSPFAYVEQATDEQAADAHPAPTLFPDGGVPFQMPSFLYATAPALASGGGAEVLPVGMLNQSNWLANNGFRKDKQPVYQDLSYEHLPREPHPPSRPFEFVDFMAPVPLAVPSPTHPTYFSPFQLEREEPQPPQELILQPPLPCTLGLHVYSATGFDVLTILSRVFNRPYPRIQLGPVDFTCSFVVVDTRRHDHPIIYCSPNFCKLTGYQDREILGRNCRFLQSPSGQLECSGQRPDPASQAAASYLRKNLTADKECQTVITNYRKDGTSFSNLLTVIPIPGGVSGGAHEENDVVFHVGFQIDLMEQPQAILENMKTGSYLTDYSAKTDPRNSTSATMNAAGCARERKSQALVAPVLLSKEMKKLLGKPSFLQSMHITTKTNAVTAGSESPETVYGGNHPLHIMLLEVGPDFVHVVSLKGSFLYVAPSVRRVLGYEPEDLVGASIADLAHPEDIVPLMRELKESSNGLAAGDGQASGGGSSSSVVLQSQPRTVDLLFRAKTKNGMYVWVESRGRLHVEPGKGKKAIILTGRAREMSNITWETIARGGGLAKSVMVQRPLASGEMEDVLLRQEFWGTMSHSAVLLMIGSGIQDILGWEPEEFHGRPISSLMLDGYSNGLDMRIKRLGRGTEADSDSAMCTSATCRMKTKEGGSAVVVVNVFRSARDPAVRNATFIPGGISPAHLLYQVRLASADTQSLYPPPGSAPSAAYPALSSNVFEALDVRRGSSWQYELQQLKFGNQRLVEEIASMEAAIKACKAKAADSSAPVGGGGGGAPSPLPALQYGLSYPGLHDHAFDFLHHLRTAALPMRASGGGGGGGGLQQMDSIASRRVVVAPIPSTFVSQRTYAVKDYLGTSPYVQRVQNDVAQAAAAAAAGSGYYSSSSLSLKRTWGSMDNHQ